MNILKVDDLKKTYVSRLGTNRVDALKGVFFSVEEASAVLLLFSDEEPPLCILPEQPDVSIRIDNNTAKIILFILYPLFKSNITA